MNKLEEQFEEMMKGIRIDAPSSDFSLKVMHRIQAEAAVQKQPVLANYQPVISKKAWIIILVAFLLLFIYITVSGKSASPESDLGLWSTISGSLHQLNTGKVSSVLQSGKGLFESIPAISYLILIASLGLWTLDSFIAKFRHHTSKV